MAKEKQQEEKAKEQNKNTEEQNATAVEDQENEGTTQAATEESEEKDPKGRQLEELSAKVNELNDKYLRIYSEFENFRRRTAKEKIDLINNANEKLIADLLPVLDDFERAIESNKKVQEADAIKEGVELVYNKMFGILSASGLKPMDSKGKEFDVEEHEALSKMKAPSKKDKGKVLEVIEKGYYLNGKVLRFAKVVIGE